MQVIPSGSTTTRVYFVMMDSGTPVAGATITAVKRVRGANAQASMTTPTTAHVADGLHYLVADEDTTITEGLAEETMVFTIEASDADTAFVTAVVKAAQLTEDELVRVGVPYPVVVNPGTGDESLGTLTFDTPS